MTCRQAGTMNEFHCFLSAITHRIVAAVRRQSSFSVGNSAHSFTLHRFNSTRHLCSTTHLNGYFTYLPADVRSRRAAKINTLGHRNVNKRQINKWDLEWVMDRESYFVAMT